jgi:hypothetical protein
MNLLAIKLVFTPLLILLASLASRRWGDVIGGWLAGLPLISAPVALFMAIEHGSAFARQAANGSLVAAAAQACFCVGYAAFASYGWPFALTGALAAFAAGAAALLHLTALNSIALFILDIVALTLALRFLPKTNAARIKRTPPSWDLPARMILVTVLVVGLPMLATRLGPQVSGVIAALPIISTVLTVFAHRLQGSNAALEVLRGMASATYGFAAFFLALSFVFAAL